MNNVPTLNTVVRLGDYRRKAATHVPAPALPDEVVKLQAAVDQLIIARQSDDEVFELAAWCDLDRAWGDLMRKRRGVQ